jgi:hypothetical protein
MERTGLAARARPSSDTSITKPKSSGQREPKWLDVLRQVAIDKRQDLVPGILDLWRAKLSAYRDPEICRALVAYRGQFFPSVDDIADLVDGERERKRVGLDGFRACGNDGCINGWRPASEKGWQRCQCLRDAIRAKQT